MHYYFSAQTSHLRTEIWACPAPSYSVLSSSLANALANSVDAPLAASPAVVRQRALLRCNPTVASLCSQLGQIFIKNFAPEFHFGRQLNLLMAVSVNYLLVEALKG